MHTNIHAAPTEILVFNMNRAQGIGGFKCNLMLPRDKGGQKKKRCVYVPLIKPSMHVEMPCDLCVTSELLGPVL